MQFDQKTTICIFCQRGTLCINLATEHWRFICPHKQDSQDNIWTISNLSKWNGMPWYSCRCAMNLQWLMKEHKPKYVTAHDSFCSSRLNTLTMSFCLCGWSSRCLGMWSTVLGDSSVQCKDRTADTCWMEREPAEKRRRSHRETRLYAALPGLYCNRPGCRWNGSLVAWVSGKNSKSIWSFGAERKCTGEFQLYRVYFTSQFNFIFMHYWIHFGAIVVRRADVFSTSPEIHSRLKYVYF